MFIISLINDRLCFGEKFRSNMTTFLAFMHVECISFSIIYKKCKLFTVSVKNTKQFTIQLHFRKDDVTKINLKIISNT